MTFVQDRVRAIDSHLERVQLDSLAPLAQSAVHTATADASSSPRIQELHVLIQAVSLSNHTKPARSSIPALCHILQESRNEKSGLDTAASAGPLENELQWFLVGKVAAQAYGLVLDAVLRQTIPLSDEVWYWNDVLGSYRYSALYSIQTSPLRLFNWSKNVWAEVKQRRNPVADGWRDVYSLARNVIRERSIADLQERVVSPLAVLRSDVRRKLSTLNHAKALNASAVGYLLSNGFDTESLRSLSDDATASGPSSDQWKAITVKSIAVMTSVLRSAQDMSNSGDDLDQAATSALDQDDFAAHAQEFFNPRSSLSNPSIKLDPHDVSLRLETLLTQNLTQFYSTTSALIRSNSRPSRLVRYWLPATALLLSSSTILRILVNRRAAIVQWIREFGATTRDFWLNWVVDPTRKIIGTIRHDSASEVSIMSRASLEGDRASLERMVVDFAVDNPEGPALSPPEIDAVRLKIREGDLTPVLRAYEKDLKSPLSGSLRGNLIRALLIQVQKTKVDVEVAMGGIDSLLKSQELVFGFVGLTPGLLVTIGAWRYLSSAFSTRKDRSRGVTQRRTYAVLRNVDRILTGSPQANDGMLSVKEFGLLVCEAVVLRDEADQVMDKGTYREFLRDFDDLIDRESGVGRQIRVAERIRWAYGRWL